MVGEVEQTASRLGRHLAHGLVAEDRLEHALREHGGAAGNADLGAGEPGRAAEGDEHEEQPDRVEPVGRDAGVGAPALALGAHQLEHLALPVAHEPFDVAVAGNFGG